MRGVTRFECPNASAPRRMHPPGRSAITLVETSVRLVTASLRDLAVMRDPFKGGELRDGDGGAVKMLKTFPILCNKVRWYRPPLRKLGHPRCPTHVS